jgi:hypothetical protein
MRKAKALGALLGACLLAAALGSPAQAAFGLLPGPEGLSATATKTDGSPALLSGSHPNEARVKVAFETQGQYADGDLRDLHLTLPPGFLLNSAALPECSAAAFGTPRVSPFQESLSGES